MSLTPDGYYVVREHGKHGEARSLFHLPAASFPFIWFGIETIESVAESDAYPSAYKIIGCDHPPYSNKAGMHVNYGVYTVYPPQKDLIGSFCWAEQISEAQYETYQEMAGLSILEFEFIEE